MANEVTVSASLKFVKNGITRLRESGSLQFDVAGTNSLEHVQSIPTAGAAITLGGITVGGYCFMKNLDATNFIEVAFSTTTSDASEHVIKLIPGDIALFRIHPEMTAPFAQSDTASCDLLVMMVDL